MLRIEIRIGDGFRSRRRTVRTILDKIHRHFNVSVAEVDHSALGSESVLGFAAVAAGRREAREVLERVAEAVGAHPRVTILDLELTDI